MSTLGVLLSCQTTQTGAYKTKSYVWVGKRLEHRQAPYIVDLEKGNKQLVFIGCDHIRDPQHPQFNAIDTYFSDLKPQIAFSEGGQVEDNVHYKNRDAAATTDGERGCLKYLCDQAGINMLDGNLTDSLEFKLTLAKHPRENFFLYYAMERVVIPYLNGAYGKQPFENLFNQAVVEWFVELGFPLAPNERSFSY